MHLLTCNLVHLDSSYFVIICQAKTVKLNFRMLNYSLCFTIQTCSVLLLDSLMIHPQVWAMSGTGSGSMTRFTQRTVAMCQSHTQVLLMTSLVLTTMCGVWVVWRRKMLNLVAASGWIWEQDGHCHLWQYQVSDLSHEHLYLYWACLYYFGLYICFHHNYHTVT